MTRQVIALSFGHLTSFDAGLGEFARRLGEGLARRAPEWRERDVHLCLQMERRLHGAFGPDVGYLPYRRRDRYAPWRLPDCVLWHNTFQHNIARPPSDVRHRVLTVHDLNYRYAMPRLGTLRDAMCTWLAIARSNRLVTISDYVKGDVERNISRRMPIETIYNGASDLTALTQTPVAGLVGRSFMFHLSRMAPSKNVDAIVELARAWPEQTFVLAGPAWGHSKRLHDELAGALPNVRVLLGIDEATKAWLLAHCEAFLFPSLTEGFGLPPIEAMYFGAPVFLSDRTCLPEIGSTQAGYFSEFSPSAMRYRIEAELPRLQATREETRRRAEVFDWDRCVAGYVALYAGLLPNGREVLMPSEVAGEALSAR